MIEDDDFKFLAYFKENINIVKYNYALHKNKHIFNYNNNFELFLKKIKEDLQFNKKICIYSNSRSYTLFFENEIKKEFPNKKILCIIENIDKIIIDEFNNSDILIYSQYVTNITYKNKVFDTFYGFFTNTIEIIEIDIKQLFEFKNINTNEFHLCTKPTGKTDYDTEIQNLKNMILKSDKKVNGISGINFDCINNKIMEDDYFHLYIFIKKRIYFKKQL